MSLDTTLEAKEIPTVQYMLILNESPAELAKRKHPEAAQAYWGGWNAFIGAMAQAGIIVKGDGLQGPEVATTVRIRDGKRSVQDGPFADTKEALGRYFVIERTSPSTREEFSPASAA